MSAYPKSPKEMTKGMMYFPRMLDKIRMHGRGELAEDYHPNLGKPRTADGACTNFLRVNYGVLRERVLKGGTDEEILAWILGSFQLQAATLPAGFAESQFGANVGSGPTAMAFAPDGRLFVCLQSGQVRVIKNGALLSVPFLSISVTSGGERGLLGVAFDPNFTSNQFVYFY